MGPGGDRAAFSAAGAVVVSHAVLALVWLVIMPQGFPPGHPRFWSNSAAPAALLGAVLATMAMRGRRSGGQILCALLAGGWGKAAAGAAALFPVSGSLPAAAGACGAAVSGLAALQRRDGRRLAGAAAAVGLLLGPLFPLAQRAPDAATRPLNAPLPAPPRNPRPAPAVLAAGGAARAWTETGTVEIEAGSLRIEAEPLLTFISRSPDRCWTLFAPAALRDGPGRLLTGWRASDERVELSYRDDGESRLSVTPEGAGVVIDSRTLLGRPVYSHLNTWCAFRVSGHARLAIGLSTQPGLRFDVEPSDYPVGRPLRFACVDRHGTVRLLQTWSGEKGPFRGLGSGPLGGDGVLALTLYDAGRAAARIELPDWAPQADTRLSPTGGWGVPMNAVEFTREGADPDAPCRIRFTLAATSVGRGWDSVGHTAGAYRNRLRIAPAGGDAGGAEGATARGVAGRHRALDTSGHGE